MSDETKKNALNMFGVEDIDKIQEEIERALDIEQPILSNFDGNFETPQYVSKSHPLLEPTASSLITMEHHHWQHELPATSNFYRETIKHVPQEKSSFLSWFKKAIALFLVLTVGTGSLGFGIGAGFGRFRSQSSPDYTSPTNTQDSATLTSINPSFEDVLGGQVGTLADIIELLEPAVVAVTGHPDGSLFSTASSGTGVIFAEDDDRIFIVTSRSIVLERSRVSVSISGSEPIDAHPAGDDATVNLSVIAIYKTQLVAAGVCTIVIATFGDSSQMRVGDVVLAIGNAMGDGNSVTRGVISALDRSTTLRSGHDVSLLQTDAAINYGTSGGPLINTRGEVIGINLNEATALFFNVASIEGIGYSLPSSTVAPLLDDIISNRRPGLGVTVTDITQEVAARHRILQLGAYIYSVVEGGAAYRGGIMPSDIITGFNGLPVLNRTQLIYAIRSAQVGDTVEVRILRNGDTPITLYVVLDAMIFDRF